MVVLAQSLVSCSNGIIMDLVLLIYSEKAAITIMALHELCLLRLLNKQRRTFRILVFR